MGKFDRFSVVLLIKNLYILLVVLSTGALSAGMRQQETPKIQIGLDVHGYPVMCPLVGAGTWQYNKTLAYESLCKAFGEGITFVDTALGYHNQEGVGEAIRGCYQGKRQDLFVLTKIPGGLSFQETLAAHRQNMFQLNIMYVDHLMVHFPSDWGQNVTGKQQRQQAWLALEEIWYTGQARSIGISHYCPSHIDDILEVATVRPSLNQVEYHVGSGDVDNVFQKCKDEKIICMSFSPLCGPCQYEPEDSLISGDLVTDIAKHHNVTGSQVALRFIVQQALNPKSFIGPVIPKSNNVEHIRQNMDLFSFELSSNDMDRLGSASKPPAEGGDCDVP